MNRAVIVLSVFLLGACSVIRPETRQGPYSNNFVEDPDFCNRTFWMIRDKLAEYSQVYLTGSEEADGLLLELQPPAGSRSFERIIASPVVNGWEVLETSFMILKSAQIDGLNYGDSGSDIRYLPSASYYIDYRANAATVTVKYWMRDKFTFVYVYRYQKRFGRWLLEEERKL